MPTETLYKDKKIINILFASMTFLLLAIFVFKINIPCLFNKYLHLKCPGCGLTRAFKSIINFNLINAFKINILSIPLFLIVITFYILYIFDITLKKHYLETILNYVSNKYKIILLILIITTLINNII